MSQGIHHLHGSDVNWDTSHSFDEDSFHNESGSSYGDHTFQPLNPTPIGMELHEEANVDWSCEITAAVVVVVFLGAIGLSIGLTDLYSVQGAEWLHHAFYNNATGVCCMVPLVFASGGIFFATIHLQENSDSILEYLDNLSDKFKEKFHDGCAQIDESLNSWYGEDPMELFYKQAGRNNPENS